MALTVGTRFGNFDVIALVGAGGMGEVFRARDTNLKRDVALKVLPPAFVADRDRVARFQREAELLAALNHPNIAQVYGLEKAHGQTAIVMELVEGPTLADRIAAGRIPPDEAMSIALQVVAALEAAHEKQIVHRDLKPANVKVRADGAVKVLDFGISKPIDPRAISGGNAVLTTPAMTETGVILGTAAYMSPEQARGKLVDERTDIWAFGCLLYEMLTGKPPFGDEDVMLTLARVLDRDADFASIPQTIAPAVRHTIKLCLEKDPRKRIADIRDVRLALEGRLESERVGSATAADARARPLWRRALFPAGAFVAGVGLAALAALAYWPEPPAPRISRQIYRPPAELAPSFSDVPGLAVAPDGSEFAYASSAGLVRRVLNELEGRVVPGTSGTFAIAPNYSIDGEYLLYGLTANGAQSGLVRIATGGGTPVQLLPAIPSYGLWPTRDGGLLASMRADFCSVMRITPGGGDPTPVFEDPTIRCAQPQLLPDEEHLLFAAQPAIGLESEGWSVVVRSVASEETPLSFPGQRPTVVDGRYLVYFEPTLGLMARAFDPKSLQYGDAVPFIDDARRLGGGQGIHGRVSASGTLVYVRDESRATTAPNALATLDASGRLERLNLATGAFLQPAYSPDGTQLALARGLDADDIQIWIYDLSGQTDSRPLTLGGRNALPSWSADSRSLVFVSDRDGIARIWRQNVDGRSAAEPLTAPADGTLHVDPVLAPDGRLAYLVIAPGSGDFDIWIVALPDGKPELLVGGAGYQGEPAFSPDGGSFAYTSNGEIFVSPYPPDGSARRVSAGDRRASRAVWSADGARLAFESGDAQLTIVALETGRRSVFGAPFSARRGDADRGRRIAAVPNSDSWLLVVEPEAAESAPAEIVIVENWIRELEARVPPLSND